MQTLFTRLVVGLLRYALVAIGLSPWLANHQILDPSDIDQLIAGAALALVTSGWMWFDKWREDRAAKTGKATQVSSGTMRNLLGLLLVLGTLTACVSVRQAPLPVAPYVGPTLAQTEKVLLAVEQVGQDLDQFPLTQAQKTAVDCGILQVVGSPDPTHPAIVRACGPSVPNEARAPLRRALAEIPLVTSCTGLQYLARLSRDPLGRLIGALSVSEDRAMVAAVLALTVAQASAELEASKCQ